MVLLDHVKQGVAQVLPEFAGLRAAMPDGEIGMLQATPEQQVWLAVVQKLSVVVKQPRATPDGAVGPYQVGDVQQVSLAVFQKLPEVADLPAAVLDGDIEPLEVAHEQQVSLSGPEPARACKTACCCLRC